MEEGVIDAKNGTRNLSGYVVGDPSYCEDFYVRQIGEWIINKHVN